MAPCIIKLLMRQVRSLFPEEIEALKAQHRQERDKRVCDRIKAVLLFDEGWAAEEIAHALLLNKDTISNHIKDYHAEHKLRPENGGSLGKLSQEQSEALIAHLQVTTYLYAKEIVAYVGHAFGVIYTIAGMTTWLKDHNFSYKKPKIVPGKADREAQEKWVKEYAAHKAALGEKDVVLFMDGVHPTHNVKPAYGWIPRGTDKEIPSNTGRQRVNLSGAINIQTKRVIIREDDTLNAVSTIKFLELIEETYPDASQIHLYCDNARYYKNKDVTTYLQHSRINMHFLPPYSPNLNPIERLWKFCYEKILYNKYYEKFTTFRSSLLEFFKKLSSKSGELFNELNQRITDNFHLTGLCKLDSPT